MKIKIICFILEIGQNTTILKISVKKNGIWKLGKSVGAGRPCPGRGTYNKAELGYLNRYHTYQTPLVQQIDTLRSSSGIPPSREEWKAFLSTASGNMSCEPDENWELGTVTRVTKEGVRVKIEG